VAEKKEASMSRAVTQARQNRIVLVVGLDRGDTSPHLRSTVIYGAQ
jgi:hypothetical protein